METINRIKFLNYVAEITGCNKLTAEGFNFILSLHNKPIFKIWFTEKSEKQYFFRVDVESVDLNKRRNATTREGRWGTYNYEHRMQSFLEKLNIGEKVMIVTDELWYVTLNFKQLQNET